MYAKPDVSRETNTCNKKLCQKIMLKWLKKAVVSTCAFNQNLKKTKHLPLEMKKQRDLNEHQNELKHYLHLSVKINGSSRKRMSVIQYVTGQNYI